MHNTKSTSGINSLLHQALAYAKRGWSVIPVKSKKAALKSWKQYQTQAPDQSTLRELFSGRGVDGLAVILGSVSGELACRDFDELAGYERWVKSHKQLAATLPTVATHRGRHVYFRGPERFVKLGDGEYRGTVGQYCVLPPSHHPAGTVYRWLIPLPESELPHVDPFESGLCNREDRENTDNTENTADRVDRENRDNTAYRALLVSSLSSLSSLSSAPSLLQDIESAIAATLTKTEGQRHRCIFSLARHLKAIPSLYGAKVGELRPIVREWHQRALPVIATKPFVDTWADFLPAWKRVKIPAGASPVDIAFKRAMERAPPPSVTELYGQDEPIVMLAKLCLELQRIMGDAEFFLDCRTAGRLIGVDHTTAWRYLDVLCADGILLAGPKGSKATGKASRFRFIDREHQ
jgi:hypothetical protein